MNIPKVVLTHATGISHTSSKNSPKVVRPVAPVTRIRASRTGARKIPNARRVGPTATSAGGWPSRCCAPSSSSWPTAPQA